jgi:hypothetical protein
MRTRASFHGILLLALLAASAAAEASDSLSAELAPSRPRRHAAGVPT